jgi:MFS-type transporter involved in bile tolerance (Atg22 family)
MHNLMVARLQKRLQAIETTMMKRENVIRFLIARFLLMGAMVVAFWVGVRYALESP